MARVKNNNHRSWLAEQIASTEARRIFEQERLVLTVTNGLAKILQDRDVSRAELARKLDRSRSFVTQVLDGTRNMTLYTLADFALALGHRATIELEDLERHGYRPLIMPRAEVRRKAPIMLAAEEGPVAPASATNPEFAIAA
jgi:transcriptional regulator with XRE-family HTH domain